GVMTDVAAASGVAGDGGQGAWGHTIGSAWGDFDNDGYLDLFVGNFSHSASYQDRPQFLRNPGAAGGAFQLMKTLDGADWQESYASPALGDYDNDGDLDLFFTTVYGGDSPVLYRNDGNWNFTNVTAAEGLSGLGPTYQAAWADIDNDGDLDLATGGKIFVNNVTDPTEGNSNHWLRVHLRGDGTTINGAAIGSEVRISVGGKTLTRQVEGGTGEGNQNDLT
ncbi:MAG: VCBS repeat-containing protein, partial [Lentisphaeria bacterium]|nr:VCBS repeat-containing protein [Lentisphaeria bacterium]